MSTPSQPNSSIALLKKIVAGILAFVLCLVVWNNFIRNRPVTEQSAAQDKPGHPNGDSFPPQSAGWDVTKLIESAASQDKVSGKSVENSENIQLDIDEIVSHNPFARTKKPKLVSTQIAGTAPVSQFLSSSSEVETESIPSDELRIDSEETSSHQPEIVPPPKIENITAIVTGGRRPAALINDQILYENDPVGDNWRIREIHTDGILLELVP